MQVAKKGIVVTLCFTAVLLFAFRSLAVNERPSHFERNTSTQSPSVNILYKNSNSAHVQGNSHGYLLTLRIMEQQTTGAKNVLQLGCLAMSMGLRAVEPFAKESFFFYPLSNEKMNLQQSFSDYYSSVSVKANYRHATFDKWDIFLSKAPKKVIFVHLFYKEVPYNSQATEVPVHSCHISNAFKHFIAKNGFTLVRCIDYVFTDETGPTVKLTDPVEFSGMIFGHYHPSEVNVVFGKWKGLGTRTRVPLKTDCRNIYSRHLMPSQSLMVASDKYIHTYLQGNKYISIMLRTEKVILHSDGRNENDFSKELRACYQKVQNIVKEVGDTTNKRLGMFMTVDLGLFGTKGDAEYKTGKHMPIDSPVYLTTIKFMKEMYGDPQWSLAQYEQTFLNTMGSKNDSGYIAGLQRTIATKSSCLIVLGGGSFQQLSIDLFENFNSAQKQICLYKVCW